MGPWRGVGWTHGLTWDHAAWYRGTMKFRDRAMLKVYMEAADLDKFAAMALAERRSTADFARELILEKLNAGGDDQNLRRDPQLPLAGGSTPSSVRPAQHDDSSGSSELERTQSPSSTDSQDETVAPVEAPSNLREMPPQPKATRSGFKKKGKPEKPSKAAGRMVNGMLICRHNLYADGCPQCKALGG